MNSEETCALLISLRSKLRNVKELVTGCESAVLFSIINNILGDRLADT